MPMRCEGRGMDELESKRSKDSPVPWPTSAYDTYSMDFLQIKVQVQKYHT